MSFGRRGGRGGAPWSRLKAVPVDQLESIGLVSKGDERLLDPKTQEAYFSTIISRYMQFCAATGRSQDDLDAAFQALSLSGEGPEGAASIVTPKPPTKTKKSASEPSPSPAPASDHELSTIIIAMRKLREGLVGTGRADAFAQRALMFITRATILTASYEAYYPSLMRLLEHVHPRCPLSPSDLREFVGYLILDLACRCGAYTEALLARQRWAFRDERIDSTLQVLMRDDYVSYWRLGALLDGYQRRILKFSEDGVRRHALKCLGRSYLAVDRPFVEKSAGREWADLKKLDAVGWELEGERVIIRKIKPKGQA